MHILIDLMNVNDLMTKVALEKKGRTSVCRVVIITETSTVRPKSNTFRALAERLAALCVSQVRIPHGTNIVWPAGRARPQH